MHIRIQGPCCGVLLGAILALGATPARARSVEDVLARHGADAERRLTPHFDRAGVSYPPKKLVLIGLKEEKSLEVWAAHGKGWRRIRSYPMTAASGEAGPKLREGDSQVPEGLYRIENLNPNSQFHLSMRVNYPNELDRKWAAKEKRVRLGGDIYIHGKAVSIGCIAIGDEAIEELFTLVAKVGAARTRLLIAPTDLRLKPPPEVSPAWTRELYQTLTKELAPFKVEDESATAR